MPLPDPARIMTLASPKDLGRWENAYAPETAKKPETRQRRFEKYMDVLIRKEKPDFGFNKVKKV